VKRYIWYFVVSLLLYPIAAKSQAQPDSSYTDLVLLKNGARIVGRIVEHVEGKQVILEREDGYRLEIPYKKIHLITKVGDSRVEEQQDALVVHYADDIMEREWQVFVRAGVIAGSGDASRGFIIHMGKVIAERYYFAAGTGYFGRSKTPEVPLSAQLLVWLSKGEMHPFITFDFGYRFLLVDANEPTSHWENGTLVGVAAGLAIPIGATSRWITQIGYMYQDSKPLGATHQVSYMVGYRIL
jgi:hypothetical protein